VARALLGSPEIILADEPTSSLDQDHREKFIELLFQVCEEKGTTVLFVSHDRTLEKMFTRTVSFLDLNQVRAL
jgi:putative ABC transport system ATP-binding protein